MNIVIDGNAFLNVSASIVKNMLHNDKRIGEKYFVNDLLDDSKFMLKQQAAVTFRNFVINYFSSIVSPFKGSAGAVFWLTRDVATEEKTFDLRANRLAEVTGGGTNSGRYFGAK